jgi:hypothetical protein
VCLGKRKTVISLIRISNSFIVINKNQLWSRESKHYSQRAALMLMFQHHKKRIIYSHLHRVSNDSRRVISMLIRIVWIVVEIHLFYWNQWRLLAWGSKILQWGIEIGSTHSVNYKILKWSWLRSAGSIWIEKRGSLK